MTNIREQRMLESILSNYKLTPMTLAVKLNPKLIPAPFHSYVSAKVAATIAKGNGRLIISAPPRHGKSEIITKNTPIWTLENYGQKNVILCTYGGELSSDFGRKIRDLVGENEHLLNMRIRQDASRVNNWLTDLGGAMMSVGIGGPITGRGADVLLIDDYIKDIKEAMSPTVRESIWEWFLSTAFTRIEPGGSCIIIATRWHEDDLIGRILKHNPGGMWESIIIPAIAEPPGYDPKDPTTHNITDVLGRHYGEPLFPERYPLGPGPGTLHERKAVLGSYFFNALFQQRPDKDNARLTDESWLKYIDSIHQLPEHVYKRLKWTRCWDLAATAEGGDWTVGALCAYDPVTKDFYICNIIREQLSPGKVEDLVKTTGLIDGPQIEIGIEQEPGSSGAALIHSYQVAMNGFTVYPNKTNTNKVLRAQPFLAHAEVGNVYLVRSGKWNSTFVEEYKEFPGGAHDDQIDTVSAAYVKLSGSEYFKAAWGRNADSSPNTVGRLDPNSTSGGLIYGDDPNDWRNQGKYRIPGTNVDIPVYDGEILPPIKSAPTITWGRNRRY